MATAVTTDVFLERFPQFAGQDDQIAALLLEAAREVDVTWEDTDIAPAIMYWVAHNLVTEETADSMPVTAEHLGPIGLSYAQPQVGADPYSLTEFGRRFVRLRKKNFGGPVVI